MRASIWSSLLMAGACLAQGDIAALLASQPDLSTLLELVGLVPGLADKLAGASNITIVAPTNDAFAALDRNVPEGEAVELKNDTTAIAALLSNHVFKGLYPSSAITEVPTFAQTLLDSSFEIPRQPFSNFTGGQWNGLVRDKDGVYVLSPELTVSVVTQPDIKLGEGIIIHKVNTVLSFGPPLQLWTYRSGYLDFNAAVEAANLGIAFGLSSPNDTNVQVSDFTVLVPDNQAFENIGSVLASADLETLRAVLRYHIIPNNVIFSPQLGNVTVKSLHGEELTFTVLPNGSCWVNNAQITFPNSILFNGVAHVIDAVLAPGPFDRASLNPSAPASERLAFPGASRVQHLPFTSIAFEGDKETYTKTPGIFQTYVAIAPSKAQATVTSSPTFVSTQPGQTSAPKVTPTTTQTNTPIVTPTAAQTAPGLRLSPGWTFAFAAGIVVVAMVL